MSLPEHIKEHAILGVKPVDVSGKFNIDQTIPQDVTGGKPIFWSGLESSSVNGVYQIKVDGYYYDTYTLNGTFAGKPAWEGGSQAGGWWIHWDNVHNLWVQQDGKSNGVNLGVYAASATLIGNWTSGIGGVSVDYIWSISNSGVATFAGIHDALNNLSIDPITRILYWTDGTTPMVDWYSGVINDASSIVSVDWVARTLNDTAGSVALNYTDGHLRTINNVYCNAVQSYELWEELGASRVADLGYRTLYASDGTTGVLKWSDTGGYISGGNDSHAVNLNEAYLYSNSYTSLDWSNRYLYASDGTTITLRYDAADGIYGGSGPNGFIDLSTCMLSSYGGSKVNSLDYLNRLLYDVNGNLVVDWSGTTYSYGTYIKTAQTDNIFPASTTSVSFGGGGAAYFGGTPGNGGLGGGGNGGIYDGAAAQNGLPNTGGGGGGAVNAQVGGTGGSGIVIIKYLTPTVVVVDEITPNIVVADQFQTVSWNLSGINDGDKDVIAGLKITVTNADAANTFYLDNIEIAQAIDVFGII